MIQGIKTIDAELAKIGIYPTDSMRRIRLAGVVQATGAFFGQKQVARLRAHFAGSFDADSAQSAMICALEDGSWVQLDRDLLASEAELSRTKTINASNDSSIEHVDAENPYGWKHSALLRSRDDHNRPAKWNAYRQALNLTTEERDRLGLPDHRVRGCTRFEVLGRQQAPTPRFDSVEVDIAKEKWRRELDETS